MWDSSNRASTRTARRFSSRRRSAFEQAGYAVVIADHYNEGARRDVHAEPLTNRQGWEACQSAHFWKAIHATACGVPHLVDFALRTCADAAHHPPTNGVDSLPPYTHPPIHHPSVPPPACLSISSASLNLCRYGNGTRILAYGQSMGGDCFLTGMLNILPG